MYEFNLARVYTHFIYIYILYILYIYMYICIYVYVYIYICIYVNMYIYIYICKSRWHHWSEWCFSWIGKKKHIEYHASSGKYLFESRGFPTDPRIEKIAGEWTYHFCWRCFFLLKCSMKFPKSDHIWKEITFNRPIILGYPSFRQVSMLYLLLKKTGHVWEIAMLVCSCKVYLLNILRGYKLLGCPRKLANG